MLTTCLMTRQKKCPTPRENDYASNVQLRIGYSVIVFVRQRGVWRRVLWTAHRTPHGVMDFSAAATTHPWLRRNNSISECTQYATGTPEMHHFEYSIEGMCWRCPPLFVRCTNTSDVKLSFMFFNVTRCKNMNQPRMNLYRAMIYVSINNTWTTFHFCKEKWFLVINFYTKNICRQMDGKISTLVHSLKYVLFGSRSKSTKGNQRVQEYSVYYLWFCPFHILYHIK